MSQMSQMTHSHFMLIRFHSGETGTASSNQLVAHKSIEGRHEQVGPNNHHFCQHRFVEFDSVKIKPKRSIGGVLLDLFELFKGVDAVFVEVGDEIGLLVSEVADSIEIPAQ